MKVGIVGCGKISRAHVSALKEVEGVEIAAVCDRDSQRAQDIANLTDGAKVYTDLALMLEREALTAVHVLTPPETHARLAIQVMESGCHVLVEKPMAANAEEAAQMQKVADENGVKLCVSHNYLFKPSVAKARELVANGEIGDVVSINSYYGLSGETGAYGSATGRAHSAWRWKLRGGVFADFLPHLVYMHLAFVDNVESIAAVTMGPDLSSGKEPSEMNVLYQSLGVSGHIAISMRAKPYAKYIEIFGTKGMIHADLVREVCTIHRNRRLPGMLSKVLFNFEDSVQLVTGTASSTAQVALGRMKSMPGLRTLVQKFYDSIKFNGAPPVTGADGRLVMEVVEKILAKSPTIPEPAPPKEAVRAEPLTDAEKILSEQQDFGKVLVTGATGFLGQRLVKALVRCNVDVVALVRDEKRVPIDMEGLAQYVRGDIRDVASLEAAMAGVSTVFHCAAVTSNNVPWKLHHEVNIVGTENVMNAAVKQGVKHVLHVSSVAIYGMENFYTNGPVPESMPYPASQDKWAYYMRSKIEAEKVALRISKEHNLPTTILRPGVLFGPGSGRPVARGLMQLGVLRLTMGSAKNRMPYTYVDNAVDAMLLAALHAPQLQVIYNVVDDQDLTVRQAATIDGRIRGEKSTIVPIPLPLLSAAAGFLESRKEKAGSETPPKLSKFVVNSASRDIAYDTTKIKQEIGWKPYVSLEEGIRRMANGSG